MASIKSTLILSSVHFKGYKSIEDLKVSLNEGLNIIIGKNGTGKSNFLECLEMSMEGRIDFKSSFKYAKLDFTLSGEKFSWVRERELFNDNISKEDIDEEPIIREKLFHGKKLIADSASPLKKTEYINQINRKIAIRSNNIRASLTRIASTPISPIYIKFKLPHNLSYIEVPGDINIELSEELDFWSTQDSLSFIKNLLFQVEFSYEGDLKKIQKINKTSFSKLLKFDDSLKESLKDYTPIKDIRFNENFTIYKNDKLITIDNLKIEFKINGKWLPWSHLSDGTKRLIYLVTEIKSSYGGFILLDEPELGVHPHQFNLIMNLIKEEAGHKQIILSTHSPQALNHLNEDELSNIIVASYDPRRNTTFRHLSNAQISKATKYMKEVGFFSDYWMLSDLE